MFILLVGNVKRTESPQRVPHSECHDFESFKVRLILLDELDDLDMRPMGDWSKRSVKKEK